MFSQVGFELHYGLLESKALLELGHESLPESGKTSKRKHVQYSSLGLMKSFTFPKESTHVQDVHGAQNFSGHHTPRTCQTSLDASKGLKIVQCTSKIWHDELQCHAMHGALRHLWQLVWRTFPRLTMMQSPRRASKHVWTTPRIDCSHCPVSETVFRQSFMFFLIAYYICLIVLWEA